MNHGQGSEAVTLEDGGVALASALELSQSRLEGSCREEGQTLLEKLSRRRLAGMDQTVVAFAGATGSGKSSLFNRVLGQDLAEAGPIRPTTGSALATSQTHPRRVLAQWLHAGDWVVLANGPTVLENGVILVDLPDIDSTESRNRDEAERLIAVADLVVWVLDPQKYADGVLHLEFLSRLREHSGSMLVALNQVDLLSQEEAPRVLEDLEALLQRSGISAPVLPVSAVTGVGVERLKDSIKELAGTKRMSALRLAADLRTQGESFRQEVSEEGGTLNPNVQIPSFKQTAEDLANLSGAGTVASAAAQSYLHRGAKATGWLPVSWIRSLKADPLDRLHLGRKSVTDGAASSLVAQSTQRTALAVTMRSYLSEAASDFPVGWKAIVLSGVKPAVEDWLDSSDSILVRSREEYAKRPGWWALMSMLQWVLGLLALVGLAWLAALWIAPTLRISLPEPPYQGPLSWPTWLLAGGLVLGLILAALSGLFLRLGAKRTRTRVSSHLGVKLEEQAASQVIPALEAELARYSGFSRNVEQLMEVRVN